MSDWPPVRDFPCWPGAKYRSTKRPDIRVHPTDEPDQMSLLTGESIYGGLGRTPNTARLAIPRLQIGHWLTLSPNY